MLHELMESSMHNRIYVSILHRMGKKLYEENPHTESRLFPLPNIVVESINSLDPDFM